MSTTRKCSGISVADASGVHFAFAVVGGDLLEIVLQPGADPGQIVSTAVLMKDTVEDALACRQRPPYLSEVAFEERQIYLKYVCCNPEEVRLRRWVPMDAPGYAG